jgi:hypothetical protein
VHFIKQGKVNVFDRDFCLEIAGKPGGYLAYDPVLAKWGLYKDIDPCDQQQ